MSGHNKWSTIKQKKGKNDAARAKVFTKIGRELMVAIRDGGSADPAVNSKLRDCIAKAKAANVPNDNIERAIKKAQGGEGRHYFDKFGGNMGTPGCVGFLFEKKGVLVIDREDLEKDEDTVMEDALEAGAADFEADEDIFTVYTEPDDLSAIRDDLTAKGYEFASAEVEQVPSTYTKIDDPDKEVMMQKMLDMFDDNDDIQNVWHNWEEA